MPNDDVFLEPAQKLFVRRYKLTDGPYQQLLAKAMRIAAEEALDAAANYVSQHDNCGDIASLDIVDIGRNREDLAALAAAISKRIEEEG